MLVIQNVCTVELVLMIPVTLGLLMLVWLSFLSWPLRYRQEEKEESFARLIERLKVQHDFCRMRVAEQELFANHSCFINMLAFDFVGGGFGGRVSASPKSKFQCFYDHGDDFCFARSADGNLSDG